MFTNQLSIPPNTYKYISDLTDHFLDVFHTFSKFKLGGPQNVVFYTRNVKVNLMVGVGKIFDFQVDLQHSILVVRTCYKYVFGLF